MENKNSSYSVQIGKTTFIVCVKQSETAKKPIEKVFKDICRHEVQEDFFSAGLLSLEKLKKSLKKMSGSNPNITQDIFIVRLERIISTTF